jgi:hypothetical protein
MADSPIRHMYVALLLDRVGQESYPNPEHLDRIEACVQSPDQLREYVELLLDRVQQTKYPSTAMLDRVQRLAMMG